MSFRINWGYSWLIWNHAFKINLCALFLSDPSYFRPNPIMNAWKGRQKEKEKKVNRKARVLRVVYATGGHSWRREEGWLQKRRSTYLIHSSRNASRLSIKLGILLYIKINYFFITKLLTWKQYFRKVKVAWPKGKSAFFAWVAKENHCKVRYWYRNAQTPEDECRRRENDKEEKARYNDVYVSTTVHNNLFGILIYWQILSLIAENSFSLDFEGFRYCICPNFHCKER